MAREPIRGLAPAAPLTQHQDMRDIIWYFDPISPFAWLQWPQIKALAAQRPVSLRPILLAGLLQQHGQKGPAEIDSKRRFTYRHAWWRAREAGLPLRFPPTHPFNPLAALRLCVAAGSSIEAVDAVLAWIWEEGRAADSPDALALLAARLGIDDAASALADPAVKATLQEHFHSAVQAGVFGVPTLAIDGELFWGEDATSFALAFLSDPALLDDPELQRIDELPVGVRRPGS
jgi:2-hydroxychromene-2-carboxylate isomerase